MPASNILHVLVPGDNVSPFDLTMAVDAGYDLVLPYTGVGTGDVAALVQDAIFSRPPKRYASTGVLIAGRDVNLATEMMDVARGALVPPFEVALYADPNGAYSTAAALVAMVEQTLEARAGAGLAGRRVAVLGTGPVGLCTAVLTARHGAKPMLCQLTEYDDVNESVRFCEHFGVVVPWVSAQSRSGRISAIENAEVIVTAAKAGVQVLTREIMSHAQNVIVAADLNAVPPTGIEGIQVMDRDVPVENGEAMFFGLGALAIGDIKYKLQKNLFRRMLNPEQPSAVLDFMSAYDLAAEMLELGNRIADRAPGAGNATGEAEAAGGAG
jgi:methylene-tetrahydromethanopterin dehydrogenase